MLKSPFPPGLTLPYGRSTTRRRDTHPGVTLMADIGFDGKVARFTGA
jgi:hypothetical protein